MRSDSDRARRDAQGGPTLPGPGGIHWASPQVILPLLAVLVTGVTFLRAEPPRPPAEVPDLRVPAEAPENPPRTEATVYVLDENGAARPVRREVVDAGGEGARLQALVDAVRTVMVEEGTWPPDLPSPQVFALEVERRPAAVLDLPAHDAPLDVAQERQILGSLERTLLEQGIERTAYLREGRAGRPWPSHLAAPSALD